MLAVVEQQEQMHLHHGLIQELLILVKVVMVQEVMLLQPVMVLVVMGVLVLLLFDTSNSNRG
jgi:uncharacterized MnhB-related membrane protein